MGVCMSHIYTGLLNTNFTLYTVIHTYLVYSRELKFKSLFIGADTCVLIGIHMGSHCGMVRFFHAGIILILHIKCS